MTRTIQSCFFQLRQLKYIRRSLTKCNLRTLLHSFVSNRLDYCNSLLAGQSETLLHRLQMVQNAASRLYAGLQYKAHITTVLRDDLHWLRIPERIDYKLCTIVFRCLNGSAPQYLKDYCKPISDCVGRRASNRSAVSKDLLVPRCRTETYGHRSFSVSGPSCWNSLPSILKQEKCYDTFKSKLKTFYFQRSYV